MRRCGFPAEYVKLSDSTERDPRVFAIPDIHGHAKGEHKPFAEERPIPLSARMLFLWFFHACRRGWPRFLMVSDHMNYLTFEDPAAVNLVRRALKLAQAGDLYGAAETASVEVGHAAVVSEGLRRGMRYSIGAEVDNDPRCRPDAQNIVDAMKPDGMIRSVHFLTITHPVHGENWNWAFDNPEFQELFEVVGTEKTWELYMTTLLDAIERLPGNIVGHFYVPAVFGHWPDDATLEKYEDQLVDACEARGMAIEFNTRFLYRDHPEEQKQKFLNSYARLLRKAKAKSVGIAVGSDAHSPKDQGGAFETVLDVLDDCEINEIVFPLAGRLARVALRVEKKPEPEPPPPPAPEPVLATAPVRKARTSESPTRPKEPRALKLDASSDGEPTLDANVPPAPTAPTKRAKAATKAAPDARATAPTPEPFESLPAPKAASVKSAMPKVEPTKAAAHKAEPAKAPKPKAAPANPAPNKAAPGKIAAKPAPPKPASIAVKAPAKTGPARIAPLKAVPIKATSVKTAPVKAAPVKAAPAKKVAPVKKAAAVKAKPAGKPALKKAPKPLPKAAHKKSPAKVVPTKKSPAKKPLAKKAPAKKAPAPKKAAPKRASAKKPAAKKAPAKKTTAKKPAAKRR